MIQKRETLHAALITTLSLTALVPAEVLPSACAAASAAVCDRLQGRRGVVPGLVGVRKGSACIAPPAAAATKNARCYSTRAYRRKVQFAVRASPPDTAKIMRQVQQTEGKFCTQQVAKHFTAVQPCPTGLGTDVVTRIAVRHEMACRPDPGPTTFTWALLLQLA